MRCAIHQPNFFPWYPFFQKMMQVDLFILLTGCQYEKNGYQNRFRIQGRWHTMSVNHGLEPIHDKRYIAPMRDWNKIKANIGMCNLSEYDVCISEDLTDTNIDIISRLQAKLKITTPITVDFPLGEQSTKRLVALCQHFNCTEYLSGISGSDYLDLSLFEQAGIKVIFQEEARMVKRHTLEVLCG